MAKRKRSTTATTPFEGTDDVDASRSSEFSPSPGEDEDYIPIKPKKAATALRKKKPAKKAAGPKKPPTAEDIPLERPPETNSDYVPIPFKGRLGFVGTTASFYHHILTNQGMPKHLPAHLESIDLLFANMPPRYDPEARRGGHGIREEPRSHQRPGSSKAHTVQRKVRDKVLADFVRDVSVCESPGAWV